MIVRAWNVLLYVAIGWSIGIATCNMATSIGCSIVNAQPPWLVPQPSAIEVEQEQVTFQLADSAEIAPQGERVAILSVGLDAKQSYGVRLIPAVPVDWIEIHDVAKPFPPRIQKPFDGKFVINGNPQQLFWVSLRTAGEPPSWISVTIGGDSGGPDPPPIGDYAALETLSREKSVALRDMATAVVLKTAINGALDNLDANIPLDAAKRTIVKAIDDAPKDGRVEWYGGWRVPISDAIGRLGITTTVEYIAAMRAVARGL